MKVNVAQLCLTLCNPMDYTVHGILQARILRWVAIPFSRGSSQPRDRTQVSRIEGGFFTSWATTESMKKTETRSANTDWGTQAKGNITQAVHPNSCFPLWPSLNAVSAPLRSSPWSFLYVYNSWICLSLNCYFPSQSIKTDLWSRFKLSQISP